MGNYKQYWYIKPSGIVGYSSRKSRKNCVYYSIESKYCSYYKCDCYGPSSPVCNGMYSEDKIIGRSVELEVRRILKPVNNNTTVRLCTVDKSETKSIRINSHKYPEHKTLLGKKKGDIVEFNGKNYVIENVN